MDTKTIQIGDYTVTVSAVKNGKDATASLLTLFAVVLYEAADFHEQNNRPLTALEYINFAFNIAESI